LIRSIIVESSIDPSFRLEQNQALANEIAIVSSPRIIENLCIEYWRLEVFLKYLLLIKGKMALENWG
jgi:hypothetical protein